MYGANNAATGEESASISAGGTAVFNSETEYVQSGFTQGNESTSTPNTNTNILWGAAATAILGATLADWQRRREEEEARKRAEAAAQEEEGGRSGKKKTPGQRAYEKMMKQKRIVGESQALLNEKAREKEEQSEKARQNLIARNEDRAPIDMAKVNQLVAQAVSQQARDDFRAGEREYAVSQAANAPKKETSWLSTLWNAGMSTLGSVVSNLIKLPKPPEPPDPTLSWFFHNVTGQVLIAPATADEIRRSPDVAAMRTYIAAAINVQRVGLNINHIGPAQLSRDELDTAYRVGFEPKGDGSFRGYGLGLPGADPYDGETAVAGMNNRIQQVLDKAEKLGEKNNLTLDETDKFIMVAMAQNGPGFDLDDIQTVMNQTRFHTEDGQINWDVYFAEKQVAWDKKVEETEWWDIWQQRNNSKTDGADYDTKFVLEEFYAKATVLQTEGYYLPENLDTKAIENLIAGYPTSVGGQ